MNALSYHDQFRNEAEKPQSAVENEHRALAASKHRHDIEPKRLVELAELELRRREDRSRYLPQELIGDVPWAMLLDLFASEQRGRTRSETDLCGSSLISPTTAMRWLLAMEQGGFLRRETSLTETPHRCVFLTDAGRNSVSSILSSHL